MSDPAGTFEQFLLWERASRDTLEVKRLYIDMASDLVAGVVLSQIVYWHLPSRDGQARLQVEREGKLWLALEGIARSADPGAAAGAPIIELRRDPSGRPSLSMRRFYLEDKSGRILVDPRGVIPPVYSGGIVPAARPLSMLA